MTEFSPFDRSDEEAVQELLARALPNPDIPDDPLYDRAIDRLLTNEIPTPNGTAMESIQEQEKLRRQLFGNNYWSEY